MAAAGQNWILVRVPIAGDGSVIGTRTPSPCAVNLRSDVLAIYRFQKFNCPLDHGIASGDKVGHGWTDQNIRLNADPFPHAAIREGVLRRHRLKSD